MAKKRPISKRSRSPKGPANATAFSILPQLELKSVRLLESNASLKIENNVVPSVFHTEYAAWIGGRNDESVVLGNLRATVSSVKDPEIPDSDQSSISISVLFQCVFNTATRVKEGDVSPEEAEEIRNLAMLACVPYVRNHVQLISASMAIAPMTLPLVRVVPAEAGRE